VIISLSGVEDVKELVNIANKYTCNINLIHGQYKVDAKSIMSVFSLDLSQPIKLEVNGECPDSLKEEIKTYEA
jgi:phosphotransferase system HPr-like phosphotransfer protein